MNVSLVVVQGKPEGAEIPIPMPVFLIGRDPQCNLRPGSDLVSKLHCAIVQRKEGVFLRDMKSTNGTFLNNDRIQGEVPLHDGDLVKVGPLVFALKIRTPVAATREPSADGTEDQAVSWLLDYTANSENKAQDLGSKTTVMDMSGAVPTAAQSHEAEKHGPPQGPDAPSAKEAGPAKPKKVTAELASDLLEKMLSPSRKKKP